MSTIISGSNGITFPTSDGFLKTSYGTFTFEMHGNIMVPLSKSKVSFSNSTSNSWTVPSGVTQIFVKMWGAGGGGGSYGGWRQGSFGGAGGHSYAMFNVTPGETITVRPGQPGWGRPGSAKAYPDGGGCSTGGGDNIYTANGGGSSSILIPSVSADYCMFAGGGGGGGGSVTGYAKNNGGAGGGVNGQPGIKTNYSGTTNKGKGGNQTSGGSAGSGSNTTGGAGSYHQGGTHQNTNCYGGGGGGGYYGGGSGAYDAGNSMGGGAGGSGFIHPDAIFGKTLAGHGNMTANGDDTLLSELSNGTEYFAIGGSEDGFGGLGLVVIYY